MYVGRTENLSKRIYEHKSKFVSGFTKKYNVEKLVYYEMYDDVNAAAERERKIKKWRREWKNKLVSDFNPDWKDLYEKIF